VKLSPAMPKSAIDPLNAGDCPESLAPSELPPPPPQLITLTLSKTPHSAAIGTARLEVVIAIWAYGAGGSGWHRTDATRVESTSSRTHTPLCNDSSSIKVPVPAVHRRLSALEIRPTNFSELVD